MVPVQLVVLVVVIVVLVVVSVALEAALVVSKSVVVEVKAQMAMMVEVLWVSLGVFSISRAIDGAKEFSSDRQLSIN